jgi:hypothetical protein
MKSYAAISNPALKLDSAKELKGSASNIFLAIKEVSVE